MIIPMIIKVVVDKPLLWFPRTRLLPPTVVVTGVEVSEEAEELRPNDAEYPPPAPPILNHHLIDDNS